MLRELAPEVQILNKYGVNTSIIAKYIGLKKSLLCKKRNKTDKYTNAFTVDEVKKLNKFLNQIKKDIEGLK